MDQDLAPVTVQAVNDAVTTQIDRCNEFVSKKDQDTANAIFSEWATDDKCLLIDAVKGDVDQCVFFYATSDMSDYGDLVIYND